jgi:hypothetical protein
MDDDAVQDFLDSARYGDLDDIKQLLDAGVDVNAADAGGNTALHKACANGHVEAASLLLNRGARCAANANGNTPLHWAALNGHVEVIRLLVGRLDADADVLAKNAFGRSALTEATAHGHEDIARLLVSHGSVAHAIAGAGAGSDAAAAGRGAGTGLDTDDGQLEEDADVPVASSDEAMGADADEAADILAKEDEGVIRSTEATR